MKSLALPAKPVKERVFTRVTMRLTPEAFGSGSKTVPDTITKLEVVINPLAGELMTAFGP